MPEHICAIKCKNGLVIALLYMQNPPSSQYGNDMAVSVGSGGVSAGYGDNVRQMANTIPISIFRNTFSVDDPRATLQPINHGPWLILSKAK